MLLLLGTNPKSLFLIDVIRALDKCILSRQIHIIVFGLYKIEKKVVLFEVQLHEINCWTKHFLFLGRRRRTKMGIRVRGASFTS